jgi:hypothetical protein
MMHLRKLALSMPPNDFPGWSDMLLRALRRNISLQEVTGGVSVWSRFSEIDKAKLKFYAKRNKQVSAILKARRDKVPLLTAWPRVFRAVRGCEIEASVIYRVFIAHDESVGSWKQDQSAPGFGA